MSGSDQDSGLVPSVSLFIEEHIAIILHFQKRLLSLLRVIIESQIIGVDFGPLRSGPNGLFLHQERVSFLQTVIICYDFIISVVMV